MCINKAQNMIWVKRQVSEYMLDDVIEIKI